jgi:hypothetical protein
VETNNPKSGPNEPAWKDKVGEETEDESIVWTNIGKQEDTDDKD